MAKIFTTAYVPDDLAQEWLQHLRDFDAKHPQCHFEVTADAPDMPLPEVMTMLQVHPGFDYKAVFERASPTEKALLTSLNSGMCPDCFAKAFKDGPRGGVSQNIECANCGSKFNVAPRYPGRKPSRLLFAQRI